MDKFTDFWKNCLGILKERMDPYQFRTWLPLLSVSEGGDQWLFFARTTFILNLVKESWLPLINDIKAKEGKNLPEIVLKVGKGEIELQDLVEGEHKPEAIPAGSKSLKRATSSGEEGESLARGYSHTRLNPELTFEHLVMGKSNRLAYSVGEAITQQLGKKDYNPFFIYGSTGLGKTHLAQAVANRVFSQGTSVNLRYIHAERFMSDFVRAVQRKDMERFTKQYQNLDLLILDDVQYIAGKEGTMEQFFYILNNTLDHGKQIILTADSLPADIDALDQRLVSRFSWGLIAEVEPPGLELRVAILKKKAISVGFRLPEEVAFFIAQNIKSNVRDLEGALNRVKAHARFTNELINIELAREALKDLLAKSREPLTIEAIQRAVSGYFNIKPADLKGSSRKRSLVRPRQLAMALAVELTEQSLPSIGEAFGGRDHSTVIHANKTIKKCCQEQDEMATDYQNLIKTLSK